MEMREWDAVRARLERARRSFENVLVDEQSWMRWRMFPIDIPLPMVAPDVATGTVSTDIGSTVFVMGIEAHYVVSGTLEEDESPASITIPETQRTKIMDYHWMLRDESTNRDWGNLPLPSSLMRSGNINPFKFMGAHARLRGGTKVTATINLDFFTSSPLLVPLVDVKSHTLQVILSGIEVKDGVL